MAKRKPKADRTSIWSGASGARPTASGSRERSWKVAWLMTASLVALVIGQLIFQYQLNLWNKAIFDALEKKDGAAVLYQAMIFVPLAAGSIAVAVAVVYARMRMQRRWRAWFTEHTMTRWLAKGRYYQLNVIEGDHKNPEARIADDIRIATEQPVDFAVGILSAALTSATFMGVLWSVGGNLTINIGGSNSSFPAIWCSRCCSIAPSSAG